MKYKQHLGYGSTRVLKGIKKKKTVKVPTFSCTGFRKVADKTQWHSVGHERPCQHLYRHLSQKQPTYRSISLNNTLSKNKETVSIWNGKLVGTKTKEKKK